MPSPPGPSWPVAGRLPGAPAGAVLTLIDARGRQAGRTTPDGAGEYLLAAPGPGDYVLLASAPGHHPQALAVRLPGPPPPDIALTPIARQVTGLVRAFPSGRPVAGAVVVASDEAGAVRATARSAADGTYALGGLGPGQHTVTATADQMWPAAVGVDVPGTARSVLCNVDMLEPVDVRGGPAPRRWTAAKTSAGDGQPAAGSTSPATSEPTSPVWPARTARPPRTTT